MAAPARQVAAATAAGRPRTWAALLWRRSRSWPTAASSPSGEILHPSLVMGGRIRTVETVDIIQRTISPSNPRYEVHPSSFRSEFSATTSPKTVPTRNVPTAKVWGYNHLSSSHLYKPHAGNQTFPRWFSVQAQGGDEKHHADTAHAKNNMGSLDVEGKSPEVISFSPLEGSISGLRNESLKIRRIELSQKLTYALIPALLIISKTKLTTSMLILAVYWQIYGFFKEIFLDYVHQEVTRKWVLVYFKLLLLILLKDTVLAFDLV